MDKPEATQAIQPIRWGVIGPGRAASRFAEGLKAVENASLDAVWGRASERARLFADQFAVPNVADSLDGLLGSEIDAVYVATHPDSHADLCVKALEAGRHVMCEKPAAQNERQVAVVLETARRNSLLFMEAMKPPFFPLYQSLILDSRHAARWMQDYLSQVCWQVPPAHSVLIREYPVVAQNGMRCSNWKHEIIIF